MTVSGTYMETAVYLCCWQQYEIFYSLTAMQREHNLVFTWLQSTVVCVWQLHISQ